ncbi:MAG: hypothetical protein LBO66_11070 [Deltaproteobacteria bacterium]|nr:hypothetical protein [Deltaproteobacteria bacterium]
MGPGDPEALAAKERLARRLAGRYGYGKISHSRARIPAEPELAAARELFRELEKTRSPGKSGDAFQETSLEVDPLRREPEFPFQGAPEGGGARR